MAKLSLHLIQELGGTKDDLRLLADLQDGDEDEDEMVHAQDLDAEPIKREEVYSFIKELKIAEHRPKEDVKEENKKPKKLLKAPEFEEDEDEDNKEKPAQPAPSSKEADPETGEKKEKKKKKERNKFKVQHSEVSSTSSVRGEEELSGHLKTQPQHTSLLVKPGDSWRDDQVSRVEEDRTDDTFKQQCKQFAVKLVENDTELYKKEREATKRGETQWMKTAVRSGTLRDKLAALVVLVEESPLHNLAAMDTLLTMARKKCKREARDSADTLKDIFISETSPLPDERKLIAFEERPLSSLWQTCSGNRDSVDRHLMMWYAEDQMKHKYAAYVKALDVMSYDTVPAVKEKALAIMHSLLTSKPEQENVLLPMLVNKLGDPNHKIASKASYLLVKLVEEHPNMKGVIAGEVECLIYRPNVTERAQYYAMCFLNQIRLHKADHALASQLISIYFAFFKVYVKKGEADSKMMAALLTGVNRAYPYAKVKQHLLTDQMGPLYQLVHIVNFNTSIQALLLLFHVIDPSNSDSDRFFMALYRKLLDPGLRSSAKQPQFLNLVYRSMKADVIDKRVLAFVKRLLQVGSLLGANFLCGALIVVSEVLKDRPHLLRIKQIGKSTEGTGVGLEDDDDEEERFVDVPLPPEFQDGDLEGAGAVSPEETPPAAEDSSPDAQKKTEGSWLHRQNLTDQRGYDRYQRNPLHCHAQAECLWELQALSRHFHPSVSLFAHTVLKGQAIEYSSDPLQDFTLIRFLERFVFKNPKKKEAVEGRKETVGAVSGKRRQAADSVPVNSAQFLQGGEEAVPEHERYLYRYLAKRAEDKKKKEEEAEGSDTGSVSDSEFDDYLDKHERQMDHDDLGDIDLGLDFARSMKGSKDTGKKSTKKADSGEDDMEEDEDDDGDDDDDGGLSDEEIDFGDDDDDELAAEFRREMEALGVTQEGNEEENDEEFDEDEELSGDELKQMMSSSNSKKRGRQHDSDVPKPKKKRGKSDLSSMFAAADDFADVLESQADMDLASAGTGDAVMVADKAGAKQIAWEMKRERQFRGRNNRKEKKFRGGKFPKGGKKQKRKS